MELESLYNLSYGMYIVGTCADGRANAQISNVVFQVTADPPKIAASVNKENLTYEMIRKSGHYSVSILREDTPMEFIGIFGYRSGRDVDKFEKAGFHLGKNSCPIVRENCIGFIEAKLVDTVDCGTHVLFIGEVTECGTFTDEEPMTYRYYRKVKGGKSPKNAPTYRGGG